MEILEEKITTRNADKLTAVLESNTNGTVNLIVKKQTFLLYRKNLFELINISVDDVKKFADMFTNLVENKKLKDIEEINRKLKQLELEKEKLIS